MADHDAGPYESRREVASLPSVGAVYDAMHAGPPGTGQRECWKLLRDACEQAGVILGTYDARIVAWLAGWEPEACAVVAGLITRAHEAGKAAGAGSAEPSRGGDGRA